MLCIIDEFTREALVIRVKRKLNSTDVLETLADVMVCRGAPDYIRSDNGPEFIATTLRKWIADVGTQTAYIEPARGRTATAKASAASSETSCSTWRSSPAFVKPRC